MDVPRPARLSINDGGAGETPHSVNITQKSPNVREKCGNDSSVDAGARTAPVGDRARTRAISADREPPRRPRAAPIARRSVADA
jgi:hypothetical protein